MTSDSTFRAQLGIPRQKNVFDYWRQRAGARIMPARADLDPAELSCHLPYIGLIDVGERPFDLRVRLAGTQLRDIYGMDLTGRNLRDVERGRWRHYWQGRYIELIERRRPVQGVIRGPVPEREHVILHWLRLPLSSDGENVDMILTLDVGRPTASPAVTRQSPRTGPKGLEQDDAYYPAAGYA